MHTANGAPPGQKSATRARGEVEEVTHFGLRAPTAPPPGVRPALPPEPVPQISDRTVRHSSGDSLSQLATPSLAGAAGEGVDAAALAFLLSQSLAEREEQKMREEGAKQALILWKQRRRKVKNEFMALLGIPPFSSQGVDEVGAGGHARRVGLLSAWLYLLGFFLVQEEEEEEQEEAEEDVVSVSGCCLRSTGSCLLLRFLIQHNAWLQRIPVHASVYVALF